VPSRATGYRRGSPVRAEGVLDPQGGHHDAVHWEHIVLPEWAAIEGTWKAGADPVHHYVHLSRFIAWCCDTGIAPVVRQAAVKWNVVCDNYRDLGLARLAVPDQARRHRRAMLPSLPASFFVDLDDYGAWLGGGDPFAPGARRRALRLKTVTLTREALKTAANAAVVGGIKPERLPG
jgi:hypothetical protein